MIGSALDKKKQQHSFFSPLFLSTDAPGKRQYIKLNELLIVSIRSLIAYIASVIIPLKYALKMRFCRLGEDRVNFEKCGNIWVKDTGPLTPEIRKPEEI